MNSGWMIAVVVGSLLTLAVISLEILLRIRAFNPQQFYPRRPGSWGVFRPSPEGTPGIVTDAYVVINRHGLRGKGMGLRSQPRILVVGGSTVEDNLLNDPETWVGRLQERLRAYVPRVWVGNMGRAGSSAVHHALQLEWMLPQLKHIDLVVVLCGLNDMLYDGGMHMRPLRSPEWDLGMAFGYRPTDHMSVLERLALTSTARRLITRLQFRLAGKSQDLPVFEMGKAFEGFKARRRRVHLEDWITTMPDQRAALERYQKNLERILEICSRHEVELVFATQPAIWQPRMTAEQESRLYAGGLNDVSDWFADPHNRWFCVPLLDRMLAAYNAEMRAICERQRLDCIDLAAKLPKDAAYFCDDFHFSVEGASAVADIVAEQLLQARALGGRGVEAPADSEFGHHDAERPTYSGTVIPQPSGSLQISGAVTIQVIACSWKTAPSPCPTMEFRVWNGSEQLVQKVVVTGTLTAENRPLPLIPLTLRIPLGPGLAPGTSQILRGDLPGVVTWPLAAGDYPNLTLVLEVSEAGTETD